MTTDRAEFLSSGNRSGQAIWVEVERSLWLDEFVAVEEADLEEANLKGAEAVK